VTWMAVTAIVFAAWVSDRSPKQQASLPTSGNLGCPRERRARRGSPGLSGPRRAPLGAQMDPWGLLGRSRPGCLANKVRL
jgi:hypothetical protein